MVKPLTRYPGQEGGEVKNVENQNSFLAIIAKLKFNFNFNFKLEAEIALISISPHLIVE